MAQTSDWTFKHYYWSADTSSIHQQVEHNPHSCSSLNPIYFLRKGDKVSILFKLKTWIHTYVTDEYNKALITVLLQSWYLSD